MIETSQEFKNLMDSNVRPKSEPVIKILDDNGNDFLVWTAKDIKNLTYKRSIDVLGREIPSMELVWTEVYGEKLNEQNYPEKYNNVAQYMVVELSFVQNLKSIASWKDIFESNTTWKEMFSRKTWRTVRNSPKTERVVLPKMFLSARPTISGKTITWKAVDILSFLTQEQIKGFFDFRYSPVIPFENPMIFSIINARSAFLSIPSVFKALTSSVEKMKGIDQEKQFNKIITTSAVNDFLVNYCATRNLHIDFEDDYFVIKKYEKAAPVYGFTGKVLKSFPRVTINPAISEYRFNAYPFLETKEEKTIYAEESEKPIYETFSAVEYWYDGYGLSDLPFAGTVFEIDRAISVVSADPSNVSVVDYSPQEQIIVNKTVSGDIYIEDNPVFPYRTKDVKYFLGNETEQKNNATRRFEFLCDYFSPNSASLEFESLPNFALETGDVVSVLTDLYSGQQRITKNAVIVGIEISYNGAMTEKIKAHEVVV